MKYTPSRWKIEKQEKEDMDKVGLVVIVLLFIVSTI